MPSTSVYLPDELAARLKNYSAKMGAEQSTNNIFVAALREYLDKYEGNYQWSDRFLKWAEGGEETEAIELDHASWREIEL